MGNTVLATLDLQVMNVHGFIVSDRMLEKIRQ